MGLCRFDSAQRPGEITNETGKVISNSLNFQNEWCKDSEISFRLRSTTDYSYQKAEDVPRGTEVSSDNRMSFRLRSTTRRYYQWNRKGHFGCTQWPELGCQKNCAVSFRLRSTARRYYQWNRKSHFSSAQWPELEYVVSAPLNDQEILPMKQEIHFDSAQWPEWGCL